MPPGNPERFNRDSLTIAERLATADPANAETQRDLSSSYNKLGDLMRAAGNLVVAERFYRDGLTIRERPATADPTNAQAQRDVEYARQRLDAVNQADPRSAQGGPSKDPVPA